MSTKGLFFVLLAAAAIAACPVSTLAQGKKVKSPQTQAAQQAAKTWLALVDAGNYAASWDAAASSFQAVVTKDQWSQAAKAVREPLGAVISRQLMSAVWTKTLPGAPDGSYVVIKEATVFGKKASAVETIVLALEKNSQWKTDGYFIR